MQQAKYGIVHGADPSANRVTMPVWIFFCFIITAVVSDLNSRTGNTPPNLGTMVVS